MVEKDSKPAPQAPNIQVGAVGREKRKRSQEIGKIGEGKGGERSQRKRKMGKRKIENHCDCSREIHFTPNRVIRQKLY